MRYLRIIIVSNETLRLTFRCKIVCSHFPDWRPSSACYYEAWPESAFIIESSIIVWKWLPPPLSASNVIYILYRDPIPRWNITDQVPHSYFFLQIIFFHFLFYNKCHGEHDLSHDFLFRVPPSIPYYIDNFPAFPRVEERRRSVVFPPERK